MAKCKRVRVGAHTKTICRNAKGRIVSTRAARNLVCPKTYRGKRVTAKNGSCYVRTKAGVRFVRKVAA